MSRISRFLAVLASVLVALTAVTALTPSAQAGAGTAPTAVAGGGPPYFYGEVGVLNVAVNRDTADGSVEVYDAADVLLGTATITAGHGSLELAAKSLAPGVHQFRLEYLGTGFFAPSTGAAQITVLKPAPQVKVNVPDTVDKSEGAKARVRVVAPNDIPVTGRVTLTIMGTSRSASGRLVDGKVVLTLPKLTTVGKTSLKVKYLGSALLHSKATTVTIMVVK
jgi:hypothetical protein